MTPTQKTPQTDNTGSSTRPAGADDVVCSGCPDAHQCRQVWSLQRPGNLGGISLVLASAAAFLLPVLTAIVAAALTGRYLRSDDHMTLWQAAAAVSGLIAGALIGWRVVRSINKRTPVSQPTLPSQENPYARQQ